MRVINVHTRSLQVGVTAVEDSLVVVSPRQVAELGLFQNFRKVLSGLDVLEVDVEPVGARFAEAVGEDRSILEVQKSFVKFNRLKSFKTFYGRNCCCLIVKMWKE
jgi:hypothetical protein